MLYFLISKILQAQEKGNISFLEGKRLYVELHCLYLQGDWLNKYLQLLPDSRHSFGSFWGWSLGLLSFSNALY